MDMITGLLLPQSCDSGHMTRILGLHDTGCQVQIFHANGHAPGPAIRPMVM